ncbi:hypothetical protein DFJ73DRAFT_825171 [Zopfochytrium polystomum]|nr:hypothetical protein DFJ73DRAFT_825171 [Zopfochytrium polystomum]
MSLHLDYMATPSSGLDGASEPSLCFKTYLFPRLSDRSLALGNGSATKSEWITLQEDAAVIRNGTTGLRTWPASLRLMEFLSEAENFSLVCGKSVLELGTGTGAVGLACAKRFGASSVTMTDSHELVLRLVRDNVHINFDAGENGDVEGTWDNPPVRVTKLDWEEAEDGEFRRLMRGDPPAGDGEGNVDLSPPIDVIIGADLVFNPLLAAHFEGRQLYAIMAVMERVESTQELFRESLEAAGLRSELLGTSPSSPSTEPWFRHEEVGVASVLQIRLESVG